MYAIVRTWKANRTFAPNFILKMKKILVFLSISAIVVSLGFGLWYELDEPLPKESKEFSLSKLLGHDENGFSHSDAPWDFQFPRDHGAHSDYKTESWFLTGYLVNEAERRFGFQLAIFRFGLKPPDTVVRASAWGTREIYRGHFAITDVTANRFFATERFSRAVLDLSGSQQMPVRVWLENWEMKFENGENESPIFSMRASDADIRVEVKLRSLKPSLLFGTNRGSSEEGTSRANFYSYSLTHLHSQGTIKLGAQEFNGEGLAWLDRAWGEIPLPIGPIVWDRFLLHLDDGSEFMATTLRRRAGGGKPRSSGIWFKPDGSTQHFGQSNMTIKILDEWTNPRNNIRYPARWLLQVPSISLNLEIVPSIADQAMEKSMPYWGGLVDIQGQFNGKPTKGHGFTELTGYDAK